MPGRIACHQQGADACMWGRHDINKVWLRHLSLHEIVRLRDIAQVDYQPCALTPSMSSQIKYCGSYVFNSDPPSKTCTSARTFHRHLSCGTDSIARKNNGSELV